MSLDPFAILKVRRKSTIFHTAVATLGITSGQWGVGLERETGAVLGLPYCVLY